MERREDETAAEDRQRPNEIKRRARQKERGQRVSEKIRYACFTNEMTVNEPG